MSSISGIGHQQVAAPSPLQAGRESVQRGKEQEEAVQKASLQQPVEFRHEVPESAGRYWLEAGEDGTALRFAPPTTAEGQAASSPGADEESMPAPGTETPSSSRPVPGQAAGQPGPAADEPGTEDAKPEKGESRTRCSTDAVDREIEQIRRREQALAKEAAGASGEDAAKVQEELEAVRRELAMKDNDTYRRQHAQFTELG